MFRNPGIILIPYTYIFYLFHVSNIFFRTLPLKFYNVFHLSYMKVKYLTHSNPIMKHDKVNHLYLLDILRIVERL